MQRIGRILVVLNEYERAKEAIREAARLAKRAGAGVTILFVHEEALFELPIYREKPLDLEEIRRGLKKIATQEGLTEPAILVAENDTVDRAVLEAEREHDTLILLPYTPKIAHRLSLKAPAPLLVLKEAKAHYAKAIVSIDSLSWAEKCLAFLKKMFPDTAIHLYQDYQYFSLPIADPFVDPMIEPYALSVETIESGEVIRARKEAFVRLCEEKGVEGTFVMGETGIDEEIAEFLKKQRGDLLVVDLQDSATPLASALEEILQKVPVDTLVCKELV